jgi:acetoacetyl-CoA synthetase
MTPASVSATVQKLMPVWRRVLQQPLIHPDDNFFDLGGDPERAFELFAEISREWGRELSPLFIYQAPTVLAVAALLEQTCPPQLLPVVLLKAGSSPPIFVAHGLGGNLMEVFELTKHIRSPHSVYGLQAQGLDGVGQPLDRVEDMARTFIDPMKQLQPHGPYRLVGYSFGGLVMLEIAQRLSRSGEKIALLAMLDTYPRGWLSLRQSGRFAMQRTRRCISAISRAVMSTSPLHLLLPLGRRAPHLRRRDKGKIHRAQLCGCFTPAMERVKARNYLALKRYRPSKYSGATLFLAAENITSFPDDPAAVWGKFAANLKVETVPGDHRAMLANHAVSAGGILSRYLAEGLEPDTVAAASKTEKL